MRSGSVISGDAVELEFERTRKRDRAYESCMQGPWGWVSLLSYFSMPALFVAAKEFDMITPDRYMDDVCLGCALNNGQVLGALKMFMALFVLAVLWSGVHLWWKFSTCPQSAHFRVRIGPEGVSAADQTSTATYAWADCNRVVRARSDRLLMFKRGTFVPIPADALPDGMTMADVLARIEAWRVAADPAAPPPMA